VKHKVGFGRLDVLTKFWSGSRTGRGKLREQNMARRTVRTWNVTIDVKEVECKLVDWIHQPHDEIERSFEAFSFIKLGLLPSHKEPNSTELVEISDYYGSYALFSDCVQ
jgi:hypothetical protein